MPTNNAHIRLGRRTGQPKKVPTNNSNMTSLPTPPWGAGGDAECLKSPVMAQESNTTAPAHAQTLSP